MTGSERAWESAFVLLAEHADRLTITQQIECQIAVMAGPERAENVVIALAAQILGERI